MFKVLDLHGDPGLNSLEQYHKTNEPQHLDQNFPLT